MNPVVLFAWSMLLGVGLAPLAMLGPLWGALACLVSMVWTGLRGCRVAVVLMGFAFGCTSVWVHAPGPVLRGYGVTEGVVASASLGREADLQVMRWARLGEPWREVSGRIRVRFRERPPTPGQRVLVFGRAREPSQSILPDAPDPVFAVSRSRIVTVLDGLAEVPVGKTPMSPAVPSHPMGGVLVALSTGDRSGVSPETWELLRRTGTSHLLAISGFHVGLVSWVGYALVLAFIRCFSLLRPRGISELPALVAALVVAVGYAGICGFPVSAQRAALMIGLACIGRALHRRAKPMSLVAVAAIGVMGIDPAAVATPGFQLSFGAVLGLVLWAAPPWLSRFDKAPRIVRWAVQGLWVTVVATAGTLPASGWWFQAVSPLSPLANLIALPWVAWVVVPMAFAMTWLPEPWSVWAGDVGGWSVDMLVWVLQPLATEPWIVAFGPWVSAAACAWLAMPKSLKWLGLVLCLLSGTRSVKPDETVITFLDVGQGDATLIEWSGGETWLVDGGGRRQQVLQYLRRRGVFSLDVVVASHGHPDHIRGLEAVVGELDVAELWIADPEGMDDLLAVAGARGVPLVRRSAQAVDPMDDAQSWGVNDRSLVLSLETQGGQVLFTGDLEAAGEKAVSGWVQGPISVLKVPHHGSKTSSTPIFLEAVQPALAVISVGRRNRFGHPDPGVLQRYAQANIPICRTDLHGTIQLRITAATTRVWTHRAGRGWRREEGLGCSPSGPLPLGDPKPHSGDRAGNRQALSNADSLPENRFQDPSS